MLEAAAGGGVAGVRARARGDVGRGARGLAVAAVEFEIARAKRSNGVGDGLAQLFSSRKMVFKGRSCAMVRGHVRGSDEAVFRDWWRKLHRGHGVRGADRRWEMGRSVDRR